MNYKTYILKEFWKLSETFTSVKLSGEHLILLPIQVYNTSNPPVPPPLPVACPSSLLVLLVGTVPTAVSLVCLLLFSYFLFLTSFFSLLLCPHLLLVQTVVLPKKVHFFFFALYS